MMLSEDSKRGQIDSVDDLVCLQSFSCSGQRIASTSSGIIPSSTPLKISVTFRRANHSQYLSGISFSSPDNSRQFGFYEYSNAKPTIVGESERLLGFTVALVAKGVVGIKFIIGKTDGTRRQKQYGTFEGNVGIGLLLPTNGSRTAGSSPFGSSKEDNYFNIKSK